MGGFMLVEGPMKAAEEVALALAFDIPGRRCVRLLREKEPPSEAAVFAVMSDRVAQLRGLHGMTLTITKTKV